MDPLFMACSLFRRRKFEDCARICTTILEKNPYDQVNEMLLLMLLLIHKLKS